MVGWKNKIYSVIKGPGWRPGSPWTGFIEEVPDVIKQRFLIQMNYTSDTTIFFYQFIEFLQ